MGRYYLCCARSGVTRCTLFMVLYLSLMCQYVLHAMLWSHIGTLPRLLAAEPRSPSELLLTCQYLCGTILVTPYSMEWDWQVSRAMPMHFCWPSCLLPFCLQLISLSLLSLYGLVLLGCDLRTARVLIALPAVHCQPFLMIIIIITMQSLFLFIYFCAQLLQWCFYYWLILVICNFSI